MKTSKTLILSTVVAVCFLVVPMTSRAGIIGNIISAIESAFHKKKDPPPPAPSNTVPLDGGISILLAAGLGLGARKLRDRKKMLAEATDL